MKNLLLLTIAALTFCLTATAQPKEVKSQKAAEITVAELLKNHLASIGSDEALASVKSRVMIGNGILTSKIGYAGRLSGLAQFASEGDKVLFAIIFNSKDYPYEKGAYNGEDITVGLPRGNRSQLSDFLKSNGAVFKEGLLGGTLSSAWSLLNINLSRSKIELTGTEKVDNQLLYRLKYFPKGGNLKVNLYFDPSTFRHVMSEYEYVISPKIGTITSNASQRERRYKLTEKFSNFRVEGKLMMPHTYAINLVVQEDATQSLDWMMNFSQFVFNESLDVNAFRVS